MQDSPLSLAGFTLPSLVCISHYSSSDKGELKHARVSKALDFPSGKMLGRCIWVVCNKQEQKTGIYMRQQ